HRLLGRCLRDRLYRYVDAAPGFGLELHFAVDEREQGVILAEADVPARMPLGAALTGQDVASQRVLAAAHLQAQALGMGLEAVASGAACLLVCHNVKSFSGLYVIDLCVEITT